MSRKHSPSLRKCSKFQTANRCSRHRGVLASAVESLECRRLFSAGPDGFGYVADATPPLDIDLTPGAPGVSSMLQNTDDDAVPIDLGTNTFTFYGHSYTGAASLFVSSNGMLSLGSPFASPYGYDLPYTDAPVIAPLWTNWVTSSNGDDQVLSKLEDMDGDATPDRLIVEWNVVYPYGGSPSPVTFQAILSLNTGDQAGDVVFNYPDLDTGYPWLDNGANAVVAIKDAGYYQAGNRLLVSYFGPLSDVPVLTGTAVRIHDAGNTAPTAEAGGPYSVAEGSTVLIDGSNSTDGAVSAQFLDYKWDFDDDGKFGEAAWDGGTNGSEFGPFAYFEANGLHAGDTRTIRLRVTDGGGLVSEDEAVVNVTPNHDPNADAGPPIGDAYTVVEGRYTQLDASLTYDQDANLDYSRFEWDFDTDGVFGEFQWAGGDNGTELGVFPQFYAGDLHAGDSRTVTLHAFDLAGASGTDTAVVNVVENQAPVAEAGPWGGGNYTVPAGGYLYLYGYGSTDPDEYVYSDTFEWDLDGDGVFGETSYNGGNPENGDEVGPGPLFVAGNLPEGSSVTVRLRVTDSGGLTSEDEATIDIVANQPPVADAGPPLWTGQSDYQVTEGGTTFLDASASYDPDGYVTSFEWDLDGDGNFGETGPDAAHGDEVGPFPIFNSAGIDGPADYTVSVRVTDNAGKTAVDTANVHVVNPVPVPYIVGMPDISAEGGVVTLDAELAQGVLAGASYSWTVYRNGVNYLTGNERLLSFTPALEGTYRVVLSVTEADGDVSASTPDTDRTFEVVNSAPRLGPVNLSSNTINEGDTVTLNGSYTDFGPNDSHTIRIDWGDGSSATTINQPAPATVSLPVAGAAAQRGGHTYYVIEGPNLSWDEAEAQAQQMGGHLATVSDGAENAFVSQLVNDRVGSNVIAWIGINDHASEGSFVWSSGEPVTYTNWFPPDGEPNNYPFTPDGEDYGVINWAGYNADGGMWNDLAGGGSGSRMVGAAVVEVNGPPASSPVGPTFSATHKYLDNPGGDNHYDVRVTVTDSDGAVSSAPGAVTWNTSAGRNGHAYLLTSTVGTFDDGEAAAVAMGGHLASIGDAQEQDFLSRTFAAASANTRAWIGLTDRVTEGTFAWTSGEPLTYQNWHFGEPNDYGGGQDFAVINHRTSGSDPVGLWDDDGAPGSDARYRGLIELPAAPASATITVKNVGPTAVTDAVTTSQDHAVTLSPAANDTDPAGVRDPLVVSSVTQPSHGTALLNANGSVTYTPLLGFYGSDTFTYGVGDGDGDGGTATGQVKVTVTPAAPGSAYTVPDPLGGTALIVNGTSAADVIALDPLPKNAPGAVVSIARKRVGTFNATGRIIVFGLDGNDVVTVTPSVPNQAWLYGDGGDDALNLGDGGGIAFGGNGSDALFGGNGRDVLVGGDGTDGLVGFGKDDILLGSWSAFDDRFAASPPASSHEAAWRSIYAEWNSSRSFNERVDNLRAGTGTATRLNGGFFLSTTTVTDDGDVDLLTGGTGSDWYIAHRTKDVLLLATTAERGKAVLLG